MTTLVLVITKQIKIKGIQLLAFAFIIMFLLNPLVVYDIGFQFSFIISFFIMLLFPFLQQIVKVTIIIHNYVYCTISFIYRCHSKLSSTSMGGIFISFDFCTVLFDYIVSAIYFILYYKSFYCQITPLNYLVDLSF